MFSRSLVSSVSVLPTAFPFPVTAPQASTGCRNGVKTQFNRGAVFILSPRVYLCPAMDEWNTLSSCVVHANASEGLNGG